MEVVFILVVLIGVGVLAWFGYKAEKARRESFVRFAESKGWVYTRDFDSSHDERYRHFHVFNQGSSRRAYNTIGGSMEIGGREMRVQMGDYRYVTESGTGKDRTETTHCLSYVIVELPWKRQGVGGGQAMIPELVIRREGFFDKVGAAFGKNDIDFESAEFSKKFFVQSPNKKFAYDICHQRMIEWLLETMEILGKGMFQGAIEIDEGDLCFLKGERNWKVEEFEEVLGWIDQFVGGWPAFVLKDLDAGLYK